MSAGQALGTIGGAVIGFFTGGPAGAVKGAYWGYMAGSIVDPPPGPHLEGPRLTDRIIQTSEDGAPLPTVSATVRTAGNVVWSTGLEEIGTTTEQGGGSGGGGATQTTYSYRTDAAIAICAGPITGVRRIWADSKLFYDVSETADLNTLLASNQKAAGIRVYTGSETQQPDPLIQAIEGAANAPAFRGTAYVVFEDLELADFGNRLPNFSFEVVTSGGLSDLYSISTADVSSSTDLRFIRYDNGKILYAVINKGGYSNPGCGISCGDVISSIVFYEYTLGDSTANSIKTVVPQHNVLWCGNGNVHPVGADEDLCIYDYYNGYSDPGHLTILVSTSGDEYVISGVYRAVVVRRGVVYLASYSGDTISTVQLSVLNSQPTAPTTVITTGLEPTIAVSDNYIYAVAYASGNYTLYKYDINNYSIIDNVTLPGRVYVHAEADDTLVYRYGNSVYRAINGDISGFVLVGTLVSIVSDYYVGIATSNVYYAINSQTSTIQTMTVGLLNQGAEQLDGVVLRILEQSGLTSAQYDVTALASDTVRGYTVGRPMAMRGALEPLQTAYHFDLAERDGKIVAVKRGGASVITIPEDDIGMAETPDGVKLKLTRHNDTELPSEVQISYSDLDNDHQAGTQYARSLTARHSNIRQISLHLVMTSQEAARLAEVVLNAARYTGRHTLEFALSYEYARLGPADVVTVPGYGVNWTARIGQSDLGMPGINQISASPEIAALYASILSGSDATGIGQSIGLTGTTTLTLLDCCMLRATDTGMAWYLGLSGSVDTWPGGAAYKSSDGGATWTVAANATRTQAASLGSATTALPTADCRVWDKTNTLTVRMQASAILSNATETAVLDGANAALLGAHGRWELIQWLTATLNGDGTYTLSNLLRGRNGTEHAAAGHAVGDAFVVPSATTIQQLDVAASELDAARDFKAVTVGQMLEAVGSSSATYTGERLRPLAPADCHAIEQQNGNYILKWSRRDRIARAWNSSSALANSEVAESYEIDVYDSGVLVTTLSASASPIEITGHLAVYEQTGPTIEHAEIVAGNLITVEHYFGATGENLSVKKRSASTYAPSATLATGAVWAAPDRYKGFCQDGSGIAFIAAHSTRDLDAKVMRLDTSTMTATHAYSSGLAADVGGIVYASGHVWASLPYSQTVVKLAAADLTLVATISVFAAESKLATDGTHVYAVSYADGKLKKINGTTNAVSDLATVITSGDAWVGVGWCYGGQVYATYGSRADPIPSKFSTSTGSRTAIATAPSRYTGAVVGGVIGYPGGTYDIATGSRIGLPTSTTAIHADAALIWDATFVLSADQVIQSGSLSYSTVTGSTVWMETAYGWTAYEETPLGADIAIHVHQISTTVGRGHAAIAAIDNLP